MLLLLLALPAAAEQWAYVWQQAWTPAVREALAETRPLVDGFMLLTADARFDSPTENLQRPNIDWAFLATLNTPVTAVVRVNLGFADHIHTSPDAAAAWLQDRFAEAQDAAAAAGVPFSSLQLDYDCPTERLDEYAAFLPSLAPIREAAPLSITTLPDWLGRDAFPKMLAAVDSYVLQVHGLDRPRDLNDPVVLCDPERARDWIAQAATLDTPYHVALPTYSYRLFFDATGAFAGLGAEGTAQALGGTTARDIHSDPLSLGALAQSLRGTPPAHCLGVTWFRLPVDGDTLNWSATTWQQVLRGERVAHAVAAELAWPQPQLLEIYLHNTASSQPGACSVELELPASRVAAYDTHNGFRLEKSPDGSRITLHGSTPTPDTRDLAAWFRFDEAIAPATIRAGKVSLRP